MEVVKIATSVRNDNKTIHKILASTSISTSTVTLESVLTAANINALGSDVSLENLNTSGDLYFSKATPATASNSYILGPSRGMQLKLSTDDYVAAASGTVNIQCLIFDS